jgi:hypothetical protein
MTLAEIKDAVTHGKRVCWTNNNFRVEHVFIENLPDIWQIRLTSDNSILELDRIYTNNSAGEDDNFFVKTGYCISPIL